MTSKEVIDEIKVALCLIHQVESCDISHVIETKTVMYPGCSPDFLNSPTGWEEINIKIRYRREP